LLCLSCWLGGRCWVVGLVGALVTLVIFACNVGCFRLWGVGWSSLGRSYSGCNKVLGMEYVSPGFRPQGSTPGFRPGFRTLVSAGFSLTPFPRSTVRSMDFDGLFGSLRFALQPSSYLQFDNNSTYSQFIRKLLTLISSTYLYVFFIVVFFTTIAFDGP
jgi:hypothetical protein